MRRTQFLLIMAILVPAAVLSACGTQPGDSPPQQGGDDPLTTAVEATCTANDLANYNFCPDSTCTPSNYNIGTSSTPLLDWEAASCQPHAYKLSIFAYPNVKVFEGFAPVDPKSNTLVTALQVNPPLDPGGHYIWSVTPILSGQEYWTPNSKTFFTGPLCSLQELAAPDLVSPADNGIVTNAHPPLWLSFAPACNPVTFSRQLDTSPSFNGTNLMSASGLPSLAQIPMTALQDCTKYYWRAQAVVQAGAGAWSGTFSFETDFDGNCGGQPTQAQGESVEENVPMFDTKLFYYGGTCAPQQVGVKIRVDAENIYNVVLFHRLHNRETGEKTEWVAVSMTSLGDDTYERVVYAADVPEAGYITSSFFQVQIVATDEDGNHIFRTDVIFEGVKLLYCGGVAPTQAQP